MHPTKNGEVQHLQIFTACSKTAVRLKLKNGIAVENHTTPIGPMLFLWRSRHRQPATCSLYMLVGSTRDVCNGRWELTIKQLASTHFTTNPQSLTGHWSTFNFGRWRLDVVPLFSIFMLIKKFPLCCLNSPPKFIEM